MFGLFKMGRCVDAPHVMPDGRVYVQTGTPAYEAAMKAVWWGRPRGFHVTWLPRHNKPHLYKPS